VSAQMQIQSQTYSVDQVAALLGLGRATAYRYVATGVIRGLRIGGRWVVHRSVVDGLLAEAAGAVATPAVSSPTGGSR
jgi:excisionase family DNA binding protein